MTSELVQLYQQREQLFMNLAELSARQLQLDDEKTVLAANARQLVAALQENTRRLSAMRVTPDPNGSSANHSDALPANA